MKLVILCLFVLVSGQFHINGEAFKQSLLADWSQLSPCELDLAIQERVATHPDQAQKLLAWKPCSNENTAACLMTGSQAHYCECKDKFGGPKCEFELGGSACANMKHYCVNGQCYTQTNAQNQFRCHCQLGYTGDKCEIWARTIECVTQKCNGQANISRSTWESSEWHRTCPNVLGSVQLPCDCHNGYELPDCGRRSSKGCYSPDEGRSCLNAFGCLDGVCDCNQDLLIHGTWFHFKGDRCETQTGTLNGNSTCHPCAESVSPTCVQHWQQANVPEQLRLQLNTSLFQWASLSEGAPNQCLQNKGKCRPAFVTYDPFYTFRELTPNEKDNGSRNSLSEKDSAGAYGGTFYVFLCDKCPEGKDGLFCDEPKQDGCHKSDFDLRRVHGRVLYDESPSLCRHGKCISGDVQRSNHTQLNPATTKYDFHCECEAGYSGEYCTEKNACVPNPCTAPSVCVFLQQSTRPMFDLHDAQTEHICVCKSSAAVHTLADCQGTYEACAQAAPENQCNLQHGQCLPCNYMIFPELICSDKQDLLNGFKCDCFDGWFGRQCNQTYETGPDIFCRRGQKILNETDHNYFCVCDIGWAGKRCDQVVDYCQANETGVALCSNGGLCLNDNSTNQFHCECIGNYFGHQCTFSSGLLSLNMVYYIVPLVLGAVSLIAAMFCVFIKWKQVRTHSTQQSDLLVSTAREQSTETSKVISTTTIPQESTLNPNDNVPPSGPPQAAPAPEEPIGKTVMMQF